jgi:hypothetical protein
VPVTETDVPTLTGADRCDRCGAAASVRVVLANGSDLLFCGHHAREYDDKLRQVAVSIQDSAEAPLASAPSGE